MLVKEIADIRDAPLRAEFDAYYTRLYGLTRDELPYILVSKEAYDEDFSRDIPRSEGEGNQAIWKLNI